MVKLSPRQVHLDFHTSPLIGGIGSRFSKENFQAALKLGHLSSITVFAKGHHGQCYYPTKVDRMHPGLDFDLLGAQIEAAHEIGVRAPIYITAGWSAQDAEEHPEWHERAKDGTVHNHNYDFSASPEDPRLPCSWITLCLNDGSYCRQIYRVAEEVCERYPVVDGLFFDICFLNKACYCPECIEGMKKAGLDPDSEADAQKYYIEKHCDFMRKCYEILTRKHPNASIFFNSGGADQYMPQYHFGSTHYELEDLPTAWGGYDKMPPRARFFARTGKHYLGMTGKFHTEWGEFGGLKTADALKFEVSSMLTYGARCSIGDQLHPDGEMEMETYRTIGEAYAYAEKIEEYCLDGQQTTRLGLYLSDDLTSDEGAEKLLLETQNDFDIVYNDEFDAFDVVVFPDCVHLDEKAKAALAGYVARGGKVLFTGESLIEDGAFLVDAGAVPAGQPQYRQDYILSGGGIPADLPSAPIVTYSGAYGVQLTDAEVLAHALPPYFERTYAHYCSHRNTPYDKTAPRTPAVIRKGNVIYMAHKICAMYKEYGAVYHKRLFEGCLALLNDRPVLEVQLPSAGRAALIHQPEHRRYCLNLLYASPVQRGKVEVVEDMPPIYGVPVVVRTANAPRRVFCPVEGEELKFTAFDGGISFTVPKVQCHQLVVIEY